MTRYSSSNRSRQNRSTRAQIGSYFPRIFAGTDGSPPSPFVAPGVPASLDFRAIMRLSLPNLRSGDLPRRRQRHGQLSILASPLRRALRFHLRRVEYARRRETSRSPGILKRGRRREQLSPSRPDQRPEIAGRGSPPAGSLAASLGDGHGRRRGRRRGPGRADLARGHLPRQPRPPGRRHQPAGRGRQHRHPRLPRGPGSHPRPGRPHGQPGPDRRRVLEARRGRCRPVVRRKLRHLVRRRGRHLVHQRHRPARPRRRPACWPLRSCWSS